MSCQSQKITAYFKPHGLEEKCSARRAKGQIRIGTRKYNSDGTFVDPSFPDFTPCVCLTRSTRSGSLGPYEVCVTEKCPEKGGTIESVWHSFKILPEIPEALCRVSRYDRTITWQYPAVSHVPDLQNGDVDMKAWLIWHDKLALSKYPIRYPFTFSPEVRATTLGVLAPERLKEYRANPESIKINAKRDLLGVAEGRRQVYFRYYIPAVKLQPKFKELQRRYDQGENLLIIDVDGPRQESLDYYREKYGVRADFIEQDTILATLENCRIMLRDPKHSCGHTFGLAMSFSRQESQFLAPF